jgi:hypothetical protein
LATAGGICRVLLDLSIPLMTSQLETVLLISAVGTGFLFAALAGLIGLMYVLTGSRLFRRPAAPAADPDPALVAELVDTRAEEKEELDRQHRAVAEASPDWRHLHRARRLGQPSARTRSRT